MFKQNQRLPLVYSVKANQYTTSVPREDVKQDKGSHEYIASSPISAQLQCQNTMLMKQKLQLVHSVKPNQYTTSVPKESVKRPEDSAKRTKALISTQRQANQYTTSAHKEDNKKETKATISTQRQAQPVHNFSAKRGC